MIEATIPIHNSDDLVLLLGTADQHLRQIRQTIPAEVSARDGKIHIRGEEKAVLLATEVLEQMKASLERDGQLTAEQVSQAIQHVLPTKDGLPRPEPIKVQSKGKSVRPKTKGQAKYIEAMRKHDLVFCVGPAGTGKTYLAVATAVEMLQQNQIKKIILARPAVEAGESLGFLPGDLRAKINPYLRPLLDALQALIDFDLVKRYMEDEVIEVVPLAYMRGRTLDDAFIIMDEGQNTTVAQMKMFLTRMGERSRIVVSGDTSQSDLPGNTRGGLADAISRLKGIRGFHCVKLTKADIVRHRLVQEIVRAYEGKK